MELRQMTYFLAAAQTQNFRKAADLCLVAQSALSRQIAALEEELGVELFRRVQKRVILTGAGREFAGYARQALETLQQGQQAMVELEAGERGTVSIGCVEALATSYLPPLFARFHRSHPNIRLRVSVRGADALMHEVEQGNLDFGLIFDPPTHPELLVVRELFRQPIMVVVGTGHPLARRDPEAGPVFLEELRNEPLIGLSEGYGLRRIMEGVYAERNLPLQFVAEIENIEGVKEFVKQGVGITFMPLALLRPGQAHEELAVLPIADLRREHIFALVYHRFASISRAGRALLETIGASI